MACDHSLAHKSNKVVVYNCDLSDKGHRTHKDQFNRVAWTVEREQVPFRSLESRRRVVWSTDVEWRRY